MLDVVLEQVTSVYGRRFLSGALVPSIAFAAAVAVVAVLVVGGLEAATAAWLELDAVTQVLLVVAGLVAALVLASVLGNSLAAVTRLYAGALPPVSWLADVSVPWHRRRRHRLEAWSLLRPGPGDDLHVAPTTLGNILALGEHYPRRRYGLEGVRSWPRLYQVLPPPFVRRLAEARASMEYMLVLSTLGWLFALVAGLIVAVGDGGRTLFAVCVGSGLVLAVLGYRGALAPATAYAVQVAAAFDLHRFDLLRALRVPLPTSASEERRTWRRLERLLHDGDHVALHHDHPS